MKGYKAFEHDLTCRDYQFTIDNTHTFESEPILCKQGFHFCTTLEDVVKYYHSPDMRVFEIEATGIITDVREDCSKRACSEIRLIREISLDEVMLSITKSETAFEWARWIGNEDIMINYITESQCAYMWALWIGNRDIMKSRVTKLYWIEEWNDIFHNDEII